jgi:hypothetical protein
MQPTVEQQEALKHIEEFINDDKTKVFILKGYAGTGKTTMIRFITDMLDARGINYKLGATTGRAAQVLQHKWSQGNRDDDEKNHIDGFNPIVMDDMVLMGAPDENFVRDIKRVKTIHGHIYKYKKVRVNNTDLFAGFEGMPSPDDPDDDYKLQFSLNVTTDEGVFIIDEASMVSETNSDQYSQAEFGSGNLLNDLFRSHSRYKFIFVGDPAQLPPVGQNFSPALFAGYIASKYKLRATEYELKEVLRINKKNPIYKAADFLRRQIENDANRKFPRFFYLKNLKRIYPLPPDSFLFAYVSGLKDYYNRKGEDGLFEFINNNIMISPTNKRVHYLNELIRRWVFGHHVEKIIEGDIIMVTQNNYKYPLFNGDFVQIMKVYPGAEFFANFKFLNVKVKKLSDQRTFDMLMFDNILLSGKSNITPEEHKRLTHEVIARHFARYKKLHGHSVPKSKVNDEMKKALDQSPYFNALRGVHGYAVTAHKAQGGEWERVYINVDKILNWKKYDKPYNWMYTALTRTTDQVFLPDMPCVKPFEKRPHFD